MLVCNVSLRHRRIVAAEIVEAGTAEDTVATEALFATIVDDSASAIDFLDAFLGEIMLEAASASDTLDGGMAFAAALTESITASDTTDGNVTAGATTTWNPSDKSANIVLSGGNLVAKSSSGGDHAVRSTTSHSSGKVYFEVLWADSIIGDTGVGIATSSAVLTSVGSTTTGGLIVYGGGNIWFNGGLVSSIGAFTLPVTICVAIDLGNSLAWMRQNAGNWNNSGTADPATNTGGINIATLFPTNAAFAISTHQDATATHTVNFGASAFAQSKPSGFSAWG